MISGHDMTSIHMTLNYTRSNILSSATVLLGSLYIIQLTMKDVLFL